MNSITKTNGRHVVWRGAHIPAALLRTQPGRATLHRLAAWAPPEPRRAQAGDRSGSALMTMYMPLRYLPFSSRALPRAKLFQGAPTPARPDQASAVWRLQLSSGRVVRPARDRPRPPAPHHSRHSGPLSELRAKGLRLGLRARCLDPTPIPGTPTTNSSTGSKRGNLRPVRSGPFRGSSSILTTQRTPQW